MSDADKEPAPSPENAAPVEAPAPKAPPATFGPAQREAVVTALGVTIATGVVMRYAFDPEHAGSSAMLLAIGALYALLAAGALVRLRQRGELYSSFRPAGGDVTLGAVTAGLLYGSARLVALVLAPHGSLREAWIRQLYLQLGDPAGDGREMVSAAVFLVAALEEITWRGLVMRALAGAYGVRRALVISALLFGVAHVPTLFLLADPVAGKNPLIVLAALGCGLVWGAIYVRTRRLLPAILAHALFSLAVVEFPIWRL